MEQLHLFYKALKNLNAKIQDDIESQTLIDALKQSSQNDDRFDFERTYCTIEEDWVEKIEKEIGFVAKAIAEDRQFIIQNGEVLPIEKIKKVSILSVRHLARHANLITRKPQNGKGVLPEKLYMVENLTDFAVYENRFLYMLLCYLRDFIALRLQEIEEVGKTYRAKLKLSKDVRYRKRHLNFEGTFSDEDKDDPLAYLFSNSMPVIKRIEDVYQTVLALLNTPLMKEVSQAPMIKPPIQKTNVLKMNNNFVHAMDLYYYISSYEKKGYTVEKISKTLAPLSDGFLTEYASIVALIAFLSYKYGSDLTRLLEEKYREGIEKEKQLEIQKLEGKIQGLRARLQSENIGLEEYLLTLEQRNNALEDVNHNLELARVEIAELKAQNQALSQKSETLEKDMDYYKREADEKLRMYYQKDAELEGKIRHLDESQRRQDLEYSQKIANIQNEIDQKVESIRQDIEESFRKAFDEQRDALQKSVEEERTHNSIVLKAQFEQRKRECETESVALKNQLEEERQKYQKLKNDYDFYMAQYIGLRQKNGLTAPLDDYTSEERFLELEAQFEHFAKFFRAEWAKTKKRIRKEILWKVKAEEGKPTQDNPPKDD